LAVSSEKGGIVPEKEAAKTNTSFHCERILGSYRDRCWTIVCPNYAIFKTGNSCQKYIQTLNG